MLSPNFHIIPINEHTTSQHTTHTWTGCIEYSNQFHSVNKKWFLQNFNQSHTDDSGSARDDAQKVVRMLMMKIKLNSSNQIDSRHKEIYEYGNPFTQRTWIISKRLWSATNVDSKWTFSFIHWWMSKFWLSAWTTIQMEAFRHKYR